jgi:hypothetical protein
MQGNHPKFLTKAELQTARADRIKRREFITLLGGAAAWPLIARAAGGNAGDRLSPQRITLPYAHLVSAFRQRQGGDPPVVAKSATATIPVVFPVMKTGTG